MTRSLYSGVTTPAASVTVYWAGTTTKPTIYAGASTGSISNPVTADWLGNYSFWIDDGHYKIVNGSIAGDLNDVRISNAIEAMPQANGLAVLPFLGSTATTQEALNEALLAGTLPMAGGTFTGALSTTDATASTSTATGSITTAGGLGVAKNSFFGGLIEWITANGSACILSSASELLTLSTSATYTDTAANLLPANSIILAVVGRITTTITTATDWSLSDTVAVSARFTDGNSTMTAGTTDVGLLHMAGDVDQVSQGPTQASADKVRVLTTGTPGAGAIRITVWYLQFVAPTS